MPHTIVDNNLRPVDIKTIVHLIYINDIYLFDIKKSKTQYFITCQNHCQICNSTVIKICQQNTTQNSTTIV